MNDFEKLERVIFKAENYVAPNHTSMGGMWTVDLYQKGDLFYRLMDEGSTSEIRYTNRLNVIRNYHNKLIFTLGDEKVLKEIAEMY